MSVNNPVHELKMDFASHTGNQDFSWVKLIRQSRRIPGLHYMMWFRFCNATRGLPVLNWLCEKQLRKVGYRYGFDIPSDTKIGGGICIKHHGLLIINHKCLIGENCSIVPGTVIGKSRGNVPRIGNNVHIGANVSIIGGITIGDDAEIGAGSVVIHDVEARSVEAGNPARIVSRK